MAAIMGHEFQISEQGWSQVGYLLAVACWGVKQLAWYTMYVPGITVYILDAGTVACVHHKDLLMRL